METERERERERERETFKYNTRFHVTIVQNILIVATSTIDTSKRSYLKVQTNFLFLC